MSLLLLDDESSEEECCIVDSQRTHINIIDNNHIDIIGESNSTSDRSNKKVRV